MYLLSDQSKNRGLGYLWSVCMFHQCISVMYLCCCGGLQVGKRISKRVCLSLTTGYGGLQCCNTVL